MQSNLSDRLSPLGGYIGHVEISPDFQLLENSTALASEVVAEFCGVLISYLKAKRSSSNNVLSVSFVCSSFLYFTCPTRNNGYLLIQFSRSQKLSGVRSSLCSILGESGL